MPKRRAAEPSDPASRLRAAGLKATAPRVAVLSLVARERHHPTADEVLAALAGSHPSISLSTVYETLEAFTRAGLCRRVVGGDGRLRVDGTVQDHDHAVCRACGAIFDVERKDVSPPSPPPRLPGGLDVIGVRLEYDVICSTCLRGSKVPPSLSRPRSRPAAGGGRRSGHTKKEVFRWRS